MAISDPQTRACANARNPSPRKAVGAGGHGHPAVWHGQAAALGGLPVRVSQGARHGPCCAAAGRRGFSLVELLVVVTVITILIALLMPAFRHQREMSHRAVCLARVSEDGQLLQQMATDLDSKLPADVNPAIGLPWLWDLTKNIRDRMLSAGASRQSFYCPSNQYQNDDALWNWTSNYTVTGYYWIFRQTNSQPALIGSDINYARRYKPTGAGSRSPSQVELVTDATISSGGDFTKVFGGWSKPHRSNHLNATNPADGNIFFRDGHAAWRDFADMQMRSPNPQQWF